MSPTLSLTNIMSKTKLGNSGGDADPAHHDGHYRDSETSHGPAEIEFSDEVSAALKSSATGASVNMTTACTSCDSSLDPMFDDANLTPFDVLLYPPHNPFSAPEDQLLQFASETHPGNVRFLVLLDLHRPFYVEAMNAGDQAEMDRITDEIVQTVTQGTVPGGKFLEWTIEEDAEGDQFGDYGDDGGQYGSEGSWTDLGGAGQARMLVLRGLRNAPVSSAFDELPTQTNRRESLALVSTSAHLDAAAAAVAAADRDDAPKHSASSAADGDKGSNKKKKKIGSGLIKKFKRSSKASSSSAAQAAEERAHSASSIAMAAAASNAAAPPTGRTGSMMSSASSASSTANSGNTAGHKRRSRSASDTESISRYAKQYRRRRLSGLPQYDESSPDPIPKSDLTRSDVLLDPNTRDDARDNASVGLSHAAKRRPGNKRFASLIEMYRPSYQRAVNENSPEGKHNIVAEIAATVYRGTTEPGRFLREDAATGMYLEVSCDRALVTVEHCLNEDPPSASASSSSTNMKR